MCYVALDNHFYRPLSDFPIVVHSDLKQTFETRFTGLATMIEGGDLGR